MNKFIYLLVFSLLANVFPSTDIQAQAPTNSFFYVYNSVDSTLNRIDENGDSQVFSLGLNEGDYTTSSDLVISPDGQTVVFCQQRFVEGSYNRDAAIVVRDIVSETNLHVVEQGVLPGCSASAFSSDGQLVAVGIVYTIPFEKNPQAENNDPGLWALQIIDVASGEIVYELRSDSEFAPDVESLTEFGFAEGIPGMARVIDFQNDQVTFIAYPFVGREGPPTVPAYVWEFESNTVQMVNHWGRLHSDYLASTGELIYPDLDENLPAVEPSGMLAQANVLNIEDADGQRTIYHNADWVVVGGQFVNNGEAILIKLMSGFDPNDPAASDITLTRFELIDREGTITAIGDTYMSYTQAKAVPNGFALLWVDHNPTEPALPVPYLDVYQDGSFTSIWTQEPDPNAPINFGEFVWASPTQISDNLSPFPAQ